MQVGIEAFESLQLPPLSRSALVMVNQRSSLGDQHVVCECREPAAIAVQLVASIEYLCRRGQYFYNDRWIEQNIPSLIVVLDRATYDDEIRVGIESFAGMRAI
jgi:hypothetical protein